MDKACIGLGFLGEIGMFKELKKRVEMADIDYENILNKSFFLR
jgi:hypothetical protein